jgi:hypothetical protein
MRGSLIARSQSRMPPGGLLPVGGEPEKMRTMDDQSTLDALTLDPAGRRRWLLTKALETASLTEALALAQAAEDFISGTASGTMDMVPEMTPVGGSHLKPEAPGGSPAQRLITAKVGNPEALEGLSSLASMDDVLRYLQRCDEGAVAETDSADELLARANRKRASQGLPSFALLPSVRAQATRPARPPRVQKIAPPRPPTARERAEWARRVAALPAA